MAKHIHIHLHRTRDASVDTPAEAKVRAVAIEMFRKAGVKPDQYNKLKNASIQEVEYQAKQFQRHLAARRGSGTGDVTPLRPSEPDEIDRGGKRYIKTDEIIPFNGKPARKYKEKNGLRYITREIESEIIHDGAYAKDALSVAEAERELKNELRLIEVFKKSGKPVPKEMIQRQKMFEEELQKAKALQSE